MRLGVLTGGLKGSALDILSLSLLLRPLSSLRAAALSLGYKPKTTSREQRSQNLRPRIFCVGPPRNGLGATAKARRRFSEGDNGLDQ